MSLSTQLKLLNSVREFLTDEGKIALPSCSESKPDYPFGTPMGQALPRCTPEEAGLDSHMLESFVRELAASPDANAHSLLILRKGHVVCEGYFSPYHKGLWHVCHSLSKSFVGTATGIALSEGLFHMDDSVIDYFPDSVGLFGRRRIKGLTVRHLLNMTSGITFNELSELVEPEWVKGILSSSLAHEPGTHFDYNSMNSYLLAALVGKTSGESVMDYLRPRLFTPLQFGPISWEKCPSGIEKGGWGIYATIEDLAKLGQLYLNLGHWNVGGVDKEILTERWVREATSRQAGNEEESYGYQMWVDHKTGYPTMSGMFGQFIAMIPPLDMVVVLMAGCPKLFGDTPAYQLMKRHFFGIQSLPHTLPANPSSLSSLQRTLHSLRFRTPVFSEKRLVQHKNTIARGTRWNSRLPRKTKVPPLYDHFLNTTWRFSQNRAGLLPVVVQIMDNNLTTGVRALRIEEREDGLLLFWEEDQTTLCIPIGMDTPLDGKIHIGRESFLTACCAEIKKDEDDRPVLRIEVCLTEHSSFRIIKLRRKADHVRLCLEEQPQISAALEMAMSRKKDGISELPYNNSAIDDLIKNNDFFHFRIAQLFSPEVIGEAVL